MAYAQATLTSPDAANAFVVVLDGLLTTAGWTTVETLTPSGNYRNRTYKSPGTTNLCHYDWYLTVCWTTTGTENYVEVWAGRAYAAGILSGISGGPQAQTSVDGLVGLNSTQPVTGDYLLTTLNMNTHIVSPTMTPCTYFQRATGLQTNPGFQTLIPSSAFAYWMSVTLDHVALFTTVAVNRQSVVYSSLALDAAYGASALYNHQPIASWTDTQFALSSSLIGVTITPSPFAYRGVHAAFSGTFGAKLPALSDQYFGAFAWRPYIYLDALSGSNGTPAYQNTAITGGVYVGYAPDIYMVYGGSIGDTVTIDGATYVLTGTFVLTNNDNTARPTLALLVE